MVRCIIFFTICCSLILVGQAKNIDSLKTVYNSDTSVVNKQSSCNSLFWHYIYKNPDSALMYARFGLEITTSNDHKMLSIFHNNLGVYHYFTDNLDSALFYYNIALKNARIAKNIQRQAFTLNNIAIIEDFKGNYNKAIDLYVESKNLHQSNGDFQSVAENLSNISIVQKLKGDYKNAILSIQQSKKIYASLNLNAEGASNYTNLALIYSDYGMPLKAIACYDTAITMFQSLNMPLELAGIYINLANIYAQQSLHNIAIKYYNKAINIYIEQKQESGAAQCFLNIAVNQFEIGLIQESEKNITKAISLFENLNFVELHFDALLNYVDIKLKNEDICGADSIIYKAENLIKNKQMLQNKARLTFYKGKILYKRCEYEKALSKFDSSASMFEKLGLVKNISESELYQAKSLFKLQQENKALLACNQSYNNAIKFGSVKLQKECTELLIEIYKKQYNYERLVHYQSIFYTLKDSLYKIDNIKSITAFELQRNFEQKLQEQKLSAKYAEQKLKTKIAYEHKLRVIFMGFVFTLAIALLLLYMQYKKKQKSYKMLVQKGKEMAFAFKYEAEKNQSGNKIRLGTSEKEVLLYKLKSWLIEDKRYLKKGIKISDVAKSLKTNSTYLSQIINSEYNKNFNQFINEFRIREACLLIHNGEHEKHTIEGISQMVGFKNRTTFYDAFKKCIGVTPVYYINSMQK